MSTPSRVESIFFAALGKKAIAERAGYLDQACGGDTELRRRVERLLEAHPQAADFMARPAVERPGGDPLDGEPHPSSLRPDPDPRIADDGPSPQAGRHEDHPGQGGPHSPAPATSSDVTTDLPRIAECPIIKDVTPTERDINGRSPAPNDIDLGTLVHPQATTDLKARPIVDFGLTGDYDAESPPDFGATGDFTPPTSTGPLEERVGVDGQRVLRGQGWRRRPREG